jgi:hypothetical protein
VIVTNPFLSKRKGIVLYLMSIDAAFCILLDPQIRDLYIAAKNFKPLYELGKVTIGETLGE